MVRSGRLENLPDSAGPSTATGMGSSTPLDPRVLLDPQEKSRMTFLKAASTVFCMALVGGMFSPSAKADDYDKKTTITFSGPVEIPPVYITGMRILPAGTYVFKLVNSSSNRHIVQIFK